MLTSWMDTLELPKMDEKCRHSFAPSLRPRGRTPAVPSYLCPPNGEFCTSLGDYWYTCYILGAIHQTNLAFVVADQVSGRTRQTHVLGKSKHTRSPQHFEAHPPSWHVASQCSLHCSQHPTSFHEHTPRNILQNLSLPPR